MDFLPNRNRTETETQYRKYIINMYCQYLKNNIKFRYRWFTTLKCQINKAGVINVASGKIPKRMSRRTKFQTSQGSCYTFDFIEYFHIYKYKNKTFTLHKTLSARKISKVAVLRVRTTQQIVYEKYINVFQKLKKEYVTKLLPQVLLAPVVQNEYSNYVIHPYLVRIQWSSDDQLQ